MQRISPRPLALLAALALFAPVATATWYTQSTHEPDNGRDDPTLMFFDPPGTATNRVYFNGYVGTTYGLVGGIASPNVGALETHNEIPTLEMARAFFGVWTDCNGDGYIGSAAGALFEYPAQLLTTTAICPAFTGSTVFWTPGAHNYNGWVSEFIPIAGTPAFGSNLTDKRVYEDFDAMVWADYGLPNDGAAAGGTCPIDPQPRGTWQSTGGFLNYVDCSSGAMEQWNAAWNGRTLAAQDIPGLNDLGIDAGLEFANDDDARGSWMDVETFGSEDSGNAAVYVFDCSDDAEPTIHSGDALNQTPAGPVAPASLQNRSVRGLDLRTGNVGDPRFIPGQVNATNEEFLSDCDTSNDRGADFYGLLEDDFNAVTGANKREANINLEFRYVIRGSAGLGPAAPVVGGPTGAEPPVKLLSSGWSDNGILVKTPRTARVNLAEASLEIREAYTMTFYGHMGTKTTGRGFVGPGGSGNYASGQCGDHDSGIHNGWNCDPATWYRNPDGTPIPEPQPLARPGQAYEFRDVDCYDGGVGDTGIGLGLPYYGTRACAPAP